MQQRGTRGIQQQQQQQEKATALYVLACFSAACSTSSVPGLLRDLPTHWPEHLKHCVLAAAAATAATSAAAASYTGGNMVAYVTKRRETREARGGLCIDEDEASFFFRQLIWAVQFCHKNHVAHR
jgi:serine/threonine protein kinase